MILWSFVGWLFGGYWLVVALSLVGVGCYRLLVGCLLAFCWLIVNCLLVVCWLIVGWCLVVCRLFGGYFVVGWLLLLFLVVILLVGKWLFSCCFG